MWCRWIQIGIIVIELVHTTLRGFSAHRRRCDAVCPRTHTIHPGKVLPLRYSGIYRILVIWVVVHVLGTT